MAFQKSIYTVQGVQKAFELLEIISECPNDATLQMLASKVDMTRNKAFRLLATLREAGLVEQEKGSSHYRLGHHSFSLAQKLLKNSSLINLTHPVIEQLARKHDEAVYMAVKKGDDVLFLDMADCNRQVKAVSLIGKSFPYFTNAAGKVMKALECSETREWLAAKFGKNKSISDPVSLASELHQIRSNGVAIDAGGLGDGIISVAVAVKDYTGGVIGAITMLGPSFRLVKERIEKEIIPSLVDGAALASSKFGYMPAR